MNKRNSIPRRLIGTLALPMGMFFVMMAFCYANGKMYYGTEAMWRPLAVNVAISVSCALGIGLQFNNGRFDFSGGAVMLLSAIIAGNLAIRIGNNLLLFSVLCIVICTALSVLVAILYVYGRLPVAVSTITMALVYEAITPLLYNGTGISLIANLELKKLSAFPLVLIPFLLSLLIYIFYKRYTTTGKQSMLLANQQSAAVNIGVNENKNVILSFLFSGIIFGCATMVWTAVTIRTASFSSLSTVGSLFTNILPVFIGLALSKYCGEAIGTLMGSITLSLMSYGLQAVLSAEMGNAISMILMGVFIFVFNVITTPYGSVIGKWREARKKKRHLNKTS